MEPLSPLDFYFAGPEVESPHQYRPGGYHPVHLGDVYHQRYRVIHKLGFGTYSTVWLARDLQSTIRTKYVALKFAVAELTGRNSEIRIHRHLASQSGTHQGSEYVLGLLDHFRVQGSNGEHDVLVFQVVGPRLEDMFDEEPSVIQQSIKSLIRDVTLGTAFLHHCGVIHADLHKANIAIEIPGLDGKSEESAMMALDVPQCVPVFTRDQRHYSNSLPRYLVIPGNLVECVDRENVHIKILDLGEAFFSTEAPQELHSPLQVRAPEALLNRLATPQKIRYNAGVDVWSVGCLIYELVTSSPLVGNAYSEAMVLRELVILLGPLPHEWMGLLEGSYSPNDGDTSFEVRINSFPEVHDAPGLAALLRRILVLEPSKRPDLSDLLDDLWFVDSPRPTTPSASE